MRVGIFTDNDFGKVNGVTTTLRAVLAHAPDDVRPRVYTLASSAVDTPDYLALRSPGMGIPFYREMSMHLPRFLAFLGAAADDGIQVVHYTTPGPMGLVAQYVASQLRRPMVGSFHTHLAEYTELLSGSPLLGHLMRQYLRWPYGRCEQILVPSTATLEALVASGLRRERLRIWSRGVDTARFSPARRCAALRRRWGADEHTVVVLYAGRLSREKGLDALPAIWQQLGERSRRMQLVLVGDGPAREALALALPRTAFAGSVTHDQVAESMASADVFLFPSRTDTLGNVVLEAQASGLPVLVSDAGGPRENMNDGETGFVCQAHGPAGFGERLASLAADTPLRRQMSTAARRYAACRSWPASLGPLFDTWRRAALAHHRLRTAPPPVAAETGR